MEDEQQGEGQPVEFPMSFDEWGSNRPAHERTLLAGFRFELRTAGGLTEQRKAAEWDAAFAAFQCAES